jgi:hypothetical protein
LTKDIVLEDHPRANQAKKVEETSQGPITKLEHMTAPDGYAFASKRPMKACRSCRWYQPYQESNKVPKKRRRHACTKVVLDGHGTPVRDPLTFVTVKGEHFGKRVDPLFSCGDFLGKGMPLVRLPEEEVA